jgi:hypothetical protein
MHAGGQASHLFGLQPAAEKRRTDRPEKYGTIESHKRDLPSAKNVKKLSHLNRLNEFKSFKPFKALIYFAFKVWKLIFAV